MKQSMVLVGVAFVVSALVGCAGQAGVSVSISPTEVALAPGASMEFTATVSGGADAGVTWTSTGGQVVPLGMTAVFTAPAEGGAYTVTVASAADPGQWASALVTVGVSDGGVASLVVRPGSLTFVEVGEEAVLEVLAFDASGAPVSLAGRAVEWRIGDSAAVDLTVDQDDPTRSTVRALGTPGSAFVSAAVVSGVEVLSPPVGISVASVLPGVELVLDAAVAFPFVDVPPDVNLASSSPPGYQIVDGVPSVAGFAGDEIAALLMAEGETLRFPVILLGEAPAVGEVLLGTGGSAIMGRVRSVETRSGTHLVQMVQVGLDEVFAAFEFSFNSEDLEAQGVLTLSSWLGADQSASIVPAADGASISGCEMEGGVTVGDIDAALEVSLSPVLEVVYVGGGLRFLVGVRGSNFGELGIEFQGGISGAISCDAGPMRSLTMALPAGPLATILSAGAIFQPKLKVAVESSFGPRFGISGRFGVEALAQAGFFHRDGTVENLSRVHATPTATIDQIVGSALGDMNFSVTPALAFDGDVGIQFGGGTLEATCTALRRIGRGARCDSLSRSLFVEALQGSFGGELQTVWDSPQRVLNQEGSESRILAAGVADVALRNEALNGVLKWFARAPVELELVSGQGEGPTLYRVFEPATIEVTSPSFTGPVAQGQVVEVEVGGSLQLIVTGAWRSALAPTFDSPLESGEVWIEAGNQVSSAIVTVDDWDSLSIELLASEALCSEAIDGLVPLRFLGFNRMIGRVPTAGYLGDVRLDCVSGPPPAVAVSITPAAVTLAPSGTHSFTATVTGATNTTVSWSATCGSIAGSGTTITYTAPGAAASCSVTATSAADSSRSASASVTVSGGEPTSGADLIVSGLSVAPASPDSGANLTVAFRVENIGYAPAGSSTVRVRLNGDPNDVTASDTLLAQLATDGLAAGQSQVYAETVQLPSGLADGTYYVWVVADVFNQADQSDYENDRSVTPILIGGSSSTACTDPTQVVTIPDPSLQAAIRATLGLPVVPIQCQDMWRMTELEANDAGIEYLDGVQHATNLGVLVVMGNRISDVSPVAGLTNLRELFLTSNSVSDVSSLENLSNLQYLVLDRNGVSTLEPLSNLVNLQWLSLESTAVTDLAPLANLTSLSNLGLSWNDIRDFSPLSSLTALQYLSLDSTLMADVSPLASLVGLRFLSLTKNAISDVEPLGNLTNLEQLYLDENAIMDVAGVGNLTRLQTLFLNHNRIRDISPLENLTNLQEFYIGDNEVSDVAPLSNLTNLTDLVLYENQIVDLAPLTDLPNLAVLILNDNQISDLAPLGGNLALGLGDDIRLNGNCLDLRSGSPDITAIDLMISRGAEVTYYPQAACGNNGDDPGPGPAGELITNGDFGSGDVGWLIGPDFWIGEGERYRSPTNYAAGGVDGNGFPISNAQGLMQQTVAIPSGVAEARFSFWYYISSDDSRPGRDHLNVLVAGSSCEILAASFDNLDSTDGVYRQHVVDVSACIGETVDVSFVATTDDLLDTVFRIDDVSLMGYE